MAGPWEQFSSAPTQTPAPMPTAAPSPVVAPASAGPWAQFSKTTSTSDVAAPPKLQKGYLEEAADDFKGTISGSWDQLKSDFIKSRGPFGSKEAAEQYSNLPFWDKLKDQWHSTVATGKLPFDAFNLVVSPLTGALRAGVAKPIAHGLKYIDPETYFPTSPEQFAANKKQVEQYNASKPSWAPDAKPFEPQTQASREDAVMQALGLIMPEKGGAGVGAAEAATGPRSTFSHIMQRPLSSPEEFAQRYAHRALTRSGVTLDQAKEGISKPGAAIVDLGDASMMEAGEQAALSGEGRRLGAKLFFDDRLKGRRGRVANAIDNMLTDKNMYEHLDEQNAAREANAEPLYDEAFKGGSTAPLRSIFEKHHAQALSDYNNSLSDLAKAHIDAPDATLEAAHNKALEVVTGAAAKVKAAKDDINFAQSVSWDHPGASAKPELWTAKTDAENALAKAQEGVKAVEQQKELSASTQEKGRQTAQENVSVKQQAHQDALERLQQAASDEAGGVKGGVWSPRLQQFLNDPIFKPGIARGLEIQRLKALEKGTKFDPKEYSITGNDADGNPIVSKVPNMRLLDAAKRGLDAILEDYRDKTTGRLVLDSRGEAIEGVRKAYVKELDDLTAENGPFPNPAYKKAREAWAGPSQVMDAVRRGMDFHKMAPEEIAKHVKGLTEPQLNGFRIGATRNVADDVAGGTRSALKVAKSIVDDDYYQRQLKAIFGDDHFKRLHDMAEQEVAFSERGSQVIGGSATARRAEGTKEFEELGSEMLDAMVTSAREGMTGFAASAKQQLGRIGARWVGEKLRGLSQARRDALGKLLFSTNHDDNVRALELLYDEGTVTLPTVPSRRAVVPAAAAGSPQQGANDQEK